MIEMLHKRIAVDPTVNVKRRGLDVLAVPYDKPAQVWDDVEKRIYTESIAPDAFRVERRRPNQVKVLRDHEHQRLIGSCKTIHPTQPDGLRAVAGISPTPLGEESLLLAADGALHVSIGFVPDPAYDEWNDDRTSVVRHSCTLYEISLVPFPAYDGADVIAVRAGPTPTSEVVGVGPALGTPNLDIVRAWLLERNYSDAGHDSAGMIG